MLQVRADAHDLRQQPEEQVAADHGGGQDAEQQQHRRHQGTAAHAGEADHEADDEARHDEIQQHPAHVVPPSGVDVPVEVKVCSPHSVFPEPDQRPALVLAGTGRTCTAAAADARVALIEQRVAESRGRAGRPRSVHGSSTKRIDLREQATAHEVVLDDVGVRACRPLIAARRSPRRRSRRGAHHRLDLADRAASVGVGLVQRAGIGERLVLDEVEIVPTRELVAQRCRSRGRSRCRGTRSASCARSGSPCRRVPRRGHRSSR